MRRAIQVPIWHHSSTHIMVLSLSMHSMEEMRHLFFKMNSQHASAFLKFREDEIPSSHFNLQLKHDRGWGNRIESHPHESPLCSTSKRSPLQGGNHKIQNRACLKWVFPLLPASAARLLFAGEAGSRSAPDVGVSRSPLSTPLSLT